MNSMCNSDGCRKSIIAGTDISRNFRVARPCKHIFCYRRCRGTIEVEVEESCPECGVEIERFSVLNSLDATEDLMEDLRQIGVEFARIMSRFRRGRRVPRILLDAYTKLRSQGEKLYRYFIVRRDMIADGTWNSRVSQTTFRENAKKINKYLRRLDTNVGEFLLNIVDEDVLETDDMETLSNYLPNSRVVTDTLIVVMQGEDRANNND